MMTASELIDALGGNTEVARIAGVGSSAVSNWRKFGCFPPRLFLVLSDAGHEKGIDVPRDLFRAITTEAA